MGRTDRSAGGRRAALALVALAAGTAVAACKAPLRGKAEVRRFRSHDEAGSGHLAILSVAPWREYAAAVQPKFDLTADAALGKVLPATGSAEERLLDMLKVVVRMAPPSTSSGVARTATTTETVGPDGATTATGERRRTATEQEAPGAAPAFAPTLPGAGRDASTLPGYGDFFPKEALGTAPMQQYLLATALYQEVALLNRYVTDAAVRRGYTPYVVRMQVSLLPRVRNAPYDAYTTVSFFPWDEALLPRIPIRLADAPDPTSRPASGCGPAPVVVPLLVTDDVETTRASHSVDTVRQYALALSALLRGFSLSADVERYTDELVTTAGRDYNSLYTVSRLAENTLRVRMGAPRTSTGQHFMLPQTHNVTALLMMPEGADPAAARSAVALARTEFVDAETGDPLAPRDGRARREATAAALRLAGDDLDVDAALALLPRVQQNDLQGFVAGFAKACPSLPAEEVPGRAMQHWVALLGVSVGNPFSVTRVDLPAPCPCRPPLPTGSPATGLDDGERLVVELAGGGDDATSLTVRLRIRTGGAAGEHLDVPASALAVHAPTAAVRASFPSLTSVRVGEQVARDEVERGAWRAELLVTGCPSACRDGRDGETFAYPVRVARIVRPTPARKPVVTVLAPAAIPAGPKADGVHRTTLPIRVRRADGVSLVTPIPFRVSWKSVEGAGAATFVSYRPGHAARVDRPIHFDAFVYTLEMGAHEQDLLVEVVTEQPPVTGTLLVETLLPDTPPIAFDVRLE